MSELGGSGAGNLLAIGEMGDLRLWRVLALL